VDSEIFNNIKLVLSSLFVDQLQSLERNWWVLAVLLQSLPLAPFTPVFRSEMQTFGVDTEVTLLHGPLMTFHYLL